MSADAGGFRSSTIQELFWTRTGLLLAILLLVSAASFGIASVMGDGPGHMLVLSLATGTLVSAVVGFCQTLLTASTSRRALVEPLVDESRRALRELSDEYRALNQEFCPTHVFEPTTEPDPAFNRMLMRDLHATRAYFFRGFSGRHAAARLLLSQAEWELRAVLADPRSAGAIGCRARYVLRQQGCADGYDAIEQRLHDEVRLGLVGLYLARSRCSRIDVTVVANPQIDRLEMFDSSVWLTLFSDAATPTAPYPKTLRFSQDSFLYAMERAEFLHVCESRTAHHATIRPDTTRPEFLTLFGRLTGTPLTDAGFDDLATRFHAFQDEFTHAAELRS